MAFAERCRADDGGSAVKILVVEDEKKTSSYLRKGLTESGFVVDIAENGSDAIYLGRTADYDLIILDESG